MGRTACTEPQCLYEGELYLTFFLIPFPWPDKRWVRDEVVWHRGRDNAVPGYIYNVLQHSFIHYESHMKLHRTENENSC
jgi:hypothetical protein